MTPAELAAELEKGRLRPAYLLAGAEPLLRDEALASIRARALEGAPEDFNYERLDGEGAKPGQLVDAARALPVMAERRLVVLREADVRGAAARPLLEALAEVVGELRGQESTVLVVTSQRPDKRSKWVKAFRDPCAVIACDPPKGTRAVASFAKEEARRAGIPLEAAAADALAEAIGPNLLALRQEIEKASLLAGPDQKVTRTHVAAIACDVAEEPIWDLTDAIGQGRTREAIGVLHRLLSGGAPPPVVLGSLASHFRKLTRTRTGGKVAGHPFAVRKLEDQARRYTPRRLEACLRAISDADEALKGLSAMPPPMALERLVIGLAG